MNYFEFYQIPVSFHVDKAKIKKIFLLNSKKYHPDFYTLESEEKQNEILELATLNNKAYQTLSNFDKRMKYVLDLKEVLGEEGKNKLPPAFLMEMMEMNEALMELEFDFEEANYNKILGDLQVVENELFNEVKAIVEKEDEKNIADKELLLVKDYFLKKRYLLRIKENLNKFATR